MDLVPVKPLLRKSVTVDLFMLSLLLLGLTVFNQQVVDKLNKGGNGTGCCGI